MYRYVLRRLLLLIPVLLGVALVVFTMLYLTPGDPAAMILGEQATTEQIEMFEEKYGLKDPYLIRFGKYIYNAVVHQDLGGSYTYNQPVVRLIMQRFPATLKLAGLGVLVALSIGIPIGIISATKQYSIFDNVTMVFALVGVSMPTFWRGMVMILIFSVTLRWLPPSGFATFKQMIMPVVAIGMSSAGIITRMTRSSMLEVVRQDYILTARAKGQREWLVILRHALGNAMIPIVTVIGLQFGYLLGGAVLTEAIFSIPGVGSLMVEAIKRKDFPIVQGGVLFVAITFSIVNLLIDILYGFLDPRIRSQYR
jgi:peptide/nickel transport system permease protein